MNFRWRRHRSCGVWDPTFDKGKGIEFKEIVSDKDILTLGNVKYRDLFSSLDRILEELYEQDQPPSQEFRDKFESSFRNSIQLVVDEVYKFEKDWKDIESKLKDVK